MKKFYLLLLVVTACQTKQATTESVTAQQSPPRALIALDTASTLVSDYLQQPTINLKDYTLGGVMPVADFAPNGKQEGLLMWYCFNAAAKQLFMAVEPYQHYDTLKMPQGPVQPVLRKPESTFLYTGAAPSPKEVQQFILDQKLTGKSAEIDNAKVTRYVKSYDSLIKTMPDASGAKYQEYAFNYFIWGADYNTLVSWAGAEGYIRYYFAFNEAHKPNRIRMVLVAVDKEGNTITTEPGKMTGSGGQALQNSWPPPPFSE